ncbi:MAG TPA: carboxypeptidase-like regulatory domain-containing protein, partial [Bacteroidales bacterium]|nr:carboxypeptidase-like regulatory domain-containing protein [Bacteroidales bacterium]
MKPIINQIVRAGLLMIALSAAIVSFGQNENFYSISGIVKDAKTGEVIAFASVSVPGTDVGTVTNSEGEFTLKIGKEMKATVFEISHLSYVNKKFNINESLGKREVFYLDQHVFQLSAVPIRPLDAREIVWIALRSINKNYSEVPNMMRGFYRESVRQRRDYLSIAEAVIDIYKAPYTGYQADQVKVFKGRTGSNVKKADTLMVQLQGGPHVALLLDIVKNTDMSIALDNLDNYQFDIVNIVNIDDKPNYVIGFKPDISKTEPLYNGKLYIDMDKLAITMAEFSLDLTDQEKASNFFVQKKPAGLIFTPTSTSYMVTYKNQNGRFYLNYVRIELKFKCDWKRKWFKNNYTITSEVA